MHRPVCPCKGFRKQIARLLKRMHTTFLSGRTSRASLHASCLQIILIIGLILKVKLQCSKVKVKVPTCTRAACHVRRIDYQRLTPCVAISATLHGNLTHFTAQYGPYYRAMWLRLQRHSNAMILRLMTAREINR